MKHYNIDREGENKYVYGNSITKFKSKTPPPAPPYQKREDLVGYTMVVLYNLQSVLVKRRLLRKNCSLEERILWRFLKNKQLGFKFRRQHSIGQYIVDFYCPSKRLVIEVDGVSHLIPEAQSSDLIRESFMNNLNIRTMRITNNRVAKMPNQVLELIKLNLLKYH